MKILSSQQIREADQYTITHEPIASIDLMERASQAFATKFLGLHPEKKPVFIFCGTGNNGGDGLAISRLLGERGWQVSTYVVGNLEKGSPDFKSNLERVPSYRQIADSKGFPDIPTDSIIIDGLFGSGLSRLIDGIHADLITYLNGKDSQRVAIDISSGLFADEPLPAKAIAFESDYTISFQLPKLAFFLPGSEKYVGKWRIVDIGLSKDLIDNQVSNYSVSEAKEMQRLIPIRPVFSHKNQVGRLMIVAGSKGKMGAAILCTQAAFKAGAGLINVHSPACGLNILQISIPEAMVSVDKGSDFIESIPNTEDTLTIGPGLGTNTKTIVALRKSLKTYKRPLVVDADGINILAENRDLLEMLPEQSILTPHPGEFKRLVGAWKNDFDKLEKLRAFCKKFELNVVLKGAFSAVCNSKGEICFNPTGNPGLATAGSGDVLTGVTGALLAQGLPPYDALRLAVYLHGMAGDEAVRQLQTPWIKASEIVGHFPNAVSSLIN